MRGEGSSWERGGEGQRGALGQEMTEENLFLKERERVISEVEGRCSLKLNPGLIDLCQAEAVR